MAEKEKIDAASVLIRKLEEKPEALNHLLNIIDRLDAIDDITAILTAGKDSATDAMVQRLADNVTTGFSVMDSFSGEEQLSMFRTAGDKSSSIKSAIETLDELERSGTLQTLKEMGNLAAGFAKGSTDMMIERMASTAEKLTEVASVLTEDNMSNLVKKAAMVSQSLESSMSKIDELERSGTLQTLKEMGDFVAGFAKGTTDMMIERMASTAEKLTELSTLVLDYDLKPLLDAAQSLNDTGTLSELIDFANALAGARKMMTDGLLDRIVQGGESFIEAVLTQVNIKELIKSFDNSMVDTIEEEKQDKYQKKGGILSLYTLTKDQDIMHGLKFMMILSKNLAKELKTHGKDIYNNIPSIMPAEEKIEHGDYNN